MSEEKKKQKKRKLLFIAIGFLVIVIIIVVVKTTIATYHFYNRTGEAETRRTLRAWSQAETDRRLKKLIEYEYIDISYVHEATVRDYSIWARIPKPPYDIHPESGKEVMTVGIFTVVAFPRPTALPEYLMTFAIREDGILREYYPDTPGVKAWGEDGDLGARTWEPIR